jgi:mannose-1-phosphate guanylyltransferase
MLIQPSQLLTVVNTHHAGYVDEEIGHQPLNTIIIQPCARETSAGILLPMLKINHRDPESIVTIFPSDHFINEEARFMDYVKQANKFVEDYPDLIVMLGVQPNQIESGYGWIEQGSSILFNGKRIIHRVRRFWEKPDSEKTEILWYNGCLWNTFVMVGRSSTFINHIKLVPEVFMRSRLSAGDWWVYRKMIHENCFGISRNELFLVCFKRITEHYALWRF